MFLDLNFEVAIRLITSSVLGALIGLEREVHGRTAGFRTHLLVSLGSCLFSLASVYIYQRYGNFGGTIPVGVDPGRIAAQLVAGIGFLGAGTIIREKASVRGLTTAACLWVAAGIGLACGIGMYVTALMVTVLSLVSLMLLKRVERGLGKDAYSVIKVWSRDFPGNKARIEEALKGCGLQLVNTSIDKNIETQNITFQFDVKYTSQHFIPILLDRLSATEGVRKVRIG